MKNKKKTYKNGLKAVSNAIGCNYYGGRWGTPLQSLLSQQIDTRVNLLTFDRNNLNYRYATDGIFRTLIQQPVQDAMKGDLLIETSQLGADEIEELKEVIDKKNILNTIKNLFIWDRLFGGAGLIIEVKGQNTYDKLTFNYINEGDDVDFYAVDRWELSGNNYLTLDQIKQSNIFDEYFYYYENKINRDRIIILKNTEAPSLIRSSLQGWGLSSAEPLVAPSNTYDKLRNAIFELIDESKIDVYHIQDLNTTLAAGEDRAVVDRLEIANSLKNFLNAVVLDKEDEFEQKQLNFGGLVDILREIKLDICSAMKIPATKVWGMSASGFNSGEDDIQNYYSMVEGEVRPQLYHVLKKVIKILCKATFGIIPNDLKLRFDDLVILRQSDIEQAKQREFTMYMNMYDKQLLTKKELAKALRKSDIYTLQAKFTELDEYGDNTVKEYDKLDI